METKGNWKIGNNTGCVVSNTEPSDKDKTTGHGEVDYYGGVLICESIRTPDDAKIIAAAPEMKKALQQCINAITGGTENEDKTYTQRFGPAFVEMLQKIINKTV